MSGAPAAGRRLPHDPALDGLRAVAVATVLLYHAGVGWSGGGFLGVDLFFVLSGFLITTLLQREHDLTGRVDLLGFWGRRARRLLPALVLVVASAIASAHLSGAGLRGDAVATLLYVANWWEIAEETSYFALFESPSPLHHTWSLAIEEQWYLVWPLAMWAWMACRPGTSGRRVGALVIGAAALSSTAAMALLAGGGDPSRAYYGTDTRAQALLVGALVAFVLADRPAATVRSRIRYDALGIAGLGTFVVMVAVVGDGDRWMYDGGFLLAAVASALAIAGVRLAPSGRLAHALGRAPMTAVGRVSYGLYLWHWPLYVLLDADRVGVGGWPLVAVRLAATGAVASVSYRFVERPIREWRPGSRSVPAGAALATALAVGAAFVVAPAAAGGPLPGERVRIDAVSDTPVVTPAAPAAGRGRPVGVRRRAPASAPGEATAAAPAAGTAGTDRAMTVPVDARPDVLIVGDSVLLELTLARHGIASAERFHVTADARLGCGTVDDARSPQCGDRIESWAESVSSDDPDLVVVGVSTWDADDYVLDGRPVEFGTRAHRAAVRAAWEENIATLTASGAPLLVLGLPCVRGESTPFDPTRARRTDPERTAAVNDLVRGVVAASAADVGWVDVRELTCPGGEHTATLDGTPLFRDGIHFADEAAPLLWDWLGPRFERALRPDAR